MFPGSGALSIRLRQQAVQRFSHGISASSGKCLHEVPLHRELCSEKPFIPKCSSERWSARDGAGRSSGASRGAAGGGSHREMPLWD